MVPFLLYRLANSIVFLSRFPMIRTNERYEGVYDPDAGLMFADKALMSLWVDICDFTSVYVSYVINSSPYRIPPVL